MRCNKPENRQISLNLIGVWLCLLLSIWFSYPRLSPGQSSTPNEEIIDVDHYKITQAPQEIQIDGKLDEDSWREATRILLNYEHYPDPNADPSVRTTFYITYTQNHLYAAFKAPVKSRENIRANLMQRDEKEKLMRDDHVGFTIDPFNNGKWGFQFRVNPLGVQADAIYSDQYETTDYTWNAIWKSEASISEDQYVVEIRIPLSSINTPADSVQTWRFSAFRNFPRSVQHQFRSHPLNLNRQSFLKQFDRLEGFGDFSTGLNMEINPVLTAKRSDQASPQNPGVMNTGSVQLNPGGNLEWGIQPNITLSATMNPDFSQVEADALQLRENRRFVLSFPEKRPFFLEGSEIFETPFNAIFTRSVIEPEAGLKLTGKSGSHTFGSFITRDQTSRLLFPSNQSSESKILNEHTYSEIIRYRHQLSPNASIGILGEGRQAVQSDYRNHVGGVDGYIQFLESNSFQFQWLQSSTHYPDPIASNYQQPDKTFEGTAFQTTVNHSSQNWKGEAGFSSVSSGFRNDNGFFKQADYQSFNFSGKRIFRGSSQNWFSELQFGPNAEFTTDQSGRLTDRSISLSATYNGPLQSEVFTEYALGKQRYLDRMYPDLQSGAFFFRIQPGHILSKLRTYISYGDQIDFTNRRVAKEIIIHPGLNFNLGEHFNLELDPNFQRLSYRGRTTFSTYLLGTKLIYHFNKQTFIRSILQYRYVDRNLSTFNNPSSFESSTESFFYQFLFSYKVNPRSKVFLGYSSGYRDTPSQSFRIQSRTGFLKVGYAWVF